MGEAQPDYIISDLWPLVVGIDSVQIDPSNAMTHDEANLDQIAGSLNKHKQRKPVVINRATGTIEAGNGTLIAARRLGWQYIAVVGEEDDAQTAVSYGIADNAVASQAWDWERLKKHLDTFDAPGEVPGVDDGLLATLKEALALEELNGKSGEQGRGGDEGPTDKAAELQEKWGCETGQVWRIESLTNPERYHRLICGDCREMEALEALLEGEKVNGVFTSPPYAMQRAKQYGGVEADQYVDWWEAVQGNMRATLAEDGSFFVNIKPHCKEGQRVLYVFDLVTAMVRRWGWRFVDELYWKRQGYPGDYKGRFKNEIEPVFHFATGKHKHSPGNVLSDFSDNSGGIDRLKNYQESAKQKLLTDSPFTKAGPGLGFARYGKDGALPGNIIQANTGAAAQQTGAYQAATFPIKLPTFFIKAYSDSLDIWLDPFAGSGTVGIAAEREGRLSRLVEKLPKYCAVILERFVNEGLAAERIIDNG